MTATAEEALAALARDLVEEISAGRALELAYDPDSPVQLAVVNVKPFSRVEHVRGKPVPEEVRAHTEQRVPGQQLEHPGNLRDLGGPGEHFVQGQPGHLIHGTSEADWLAHQWKAEPKTGAAAVHPHLGGHLARQPGDTISGHAHAGIPRPLPVHPEEPTTLEHQGTRLLPSSHLGLTRDKMPQLAGPAQPGTPAEKMGGGAGQFVDLRDAFATHLRRRGIAVTEENVPASSLKPSQSELNASKVGGLAELAADGDPDAIKSLTRPIYVSRDNYVLDGHHKWGARLLLDQNGTRFGANANNDLLNVRRVNLDAHEALAEARAFSERMGVAPRTVAETAGAGSIRPEILHNMAPDEGASYAPLSDAEYAAHARQAEDQIAAALAAGQSTDKTETLDGYGAWKPERAAIHNEIVKQLVDKADAVPSEGRGLIMGGLGGAGKSTVLGQIPDIDVSRYAVVNPDDIKEEMARRDMIPQLGDLSPMERAALVHEESSHIANLLAQELLSRRKNLAFDITMSSLGSVQRRLDWYGQHGYEAPQAVFVHIPVETSVERAQARHRGGLEAYRQGKGLGGRLVPSGVIRSSETTPGSTANRETFDALRPRFSAWQLWDNSGSKPVLVDRSKPPQAPGIASVEDLVRSLESGPQAIRGPPAVAQPRPLNTEAAARAAEQGMLAG